MTKFIVGNVSNADVRNVRNVRVCETKACAKITPKQLWAMGILQCHTCGGKLVNNNQTTNAK